MPGPVLDEGDRFVIRVLREEGPDSFEEALYVVPKTARDVWWSDAQGRFDLPDIPLPEPAHSLPAIERAESRLDGDGCVTEVWNNQSLDDSLLPPERNLVTAVWTGNSSCASSTATRPWLR